MKKIGDLYWSQLSAWDFSDKKNIDAFCANGFHFELMIVTNVVSDNQWKNRKVKIDELPQDKINALIPDNGHNWSKVMGNNLDLINDES